MKELILQGGEVVLLDDEDYEKIHSFTWKLQKQGGKIRIISSDCGNATFTTLHRKLFGYLGPKARPVFRDENYLNYQRSNILMSHKTTPANARRGVAAEHCPYGKCSIAPAGTDTNGVRCNGDSSQCPIQHYDSYRICMNIAAKRDWPGWAREEQT